MNTLHRIVCVGIVGTTLFITGCSSTPKTEQPADPMASLQKYSAEELRPLAEEGDADAQFLMGMKYAAGQDLEQNEFEAANWYRMAAEQGHAQAQNNLGMMHYNGQGIPQSYSEAAHWLQLAAD